jgi:hypothetical protein
VSSPPLPHAIIIMSEYWFNKNSQFESAPWPFWKQLQSRRGQLFCARPDSVSLKTHLTDFVLSYLGYCHGQKRKKYYQLLEVPSENWCNLTAHLTLFIQKILITFQSGNKCLMSLKVIFFLLTTWQKTLGFLNTSFTN